MPKKQEKTIWEEFKKWRKKNPRSTKIIIGIIVVIFYFSLPIFYNPTYSSSPSDYWEFLNIPFAVVIWELLVREPLMGLFKNP